MTQQQLPISLSLNAWIEPYWRSGHTKLETSNSIPNVKIEKLSTGPTSIYEISLEHAVLLLFAFFQRKMSVIRRINALLQSGCVYTSPTGPMYSSSCIGLLNFLFVCKSYEQSFDVCWYHLVFKILKKKGIYLRILRFCAQLCVTTLFR